MEGRAENKSLTQKWNERKVKAKRNKSKHGTTTKIPLNMPRMSTDKEKKEESNVYKKQKRKKETTHKNAFVLRPQSRGFAIGHLS